MKTDKNVQDVAMMLGALGDIGRNTVMRAHVVDALRAIERDVKLPLNRSIREELTGPICDAMFEEGERLSKTLLDGTRFQFAYTSKIARDFILAPDDEPDHVFEPQTTKLFLHLSKTARSVVIGGAYAGDHAVPGAKIAPSDARFYCFEPNDLQRELLALNALDNAVRNKIVISDLGLWSAGPVALRFIGEDAFAHAVLAEGSHKTSDEQDVFYATSIETYMAEHDEADLDLILMDIEGSELEALKGAARFLSRAAADAPDIIFEVHRSYVDWSNGIENTELVKVLRGFGYTVYAVRDFQSNVSMPDCAVELVGLQNVYLEGPPHGFNMLAMKDTSKLSDPLFRIVDGVSPKLLLHKDREIHWPSEWR